MKILDLALIDNSKIMEKNMKEEELSALAREYAEEVYKKSHKEMEVLPNCLSNEAIEMFAKDMNHKLQWLSQRFFLVEKSKVTEEYKHTCESVNKHSTTTGCLFFVGQKQTLESLFPKIAKEVEG